MKKYFKIGEIAKLYHIGTDSLRYYEKLGILTPKRSENDYRLYSLHDIWRLNVIRDLRNLDFSMEQIKDYLNNRSITSTESLFEQELSAIDNKLEELYALRENVQNRLQTLKDVRRHPLGIIEQTYHHTRHCHMIQSGYQTDEEMDVLIKQLLNKDEHNLYIIGNNRIGSLLALNDVRKRHFQGYQAVFIIDEHGNDTLPAGNYLSLCYQGSCNQNAKYIPKMLDYASQNGLTPVDPVLEILWVDIHQSEDTNEHIIQLQIRCI